MEKRCSSLRTCFSLVFHSIFAVVLAVLFRFVLQNKDQLFRDFVKPHWRYFSKAVKIREPLILGEFGRVVPLADDFPAATFDWSVFKNEYVAKSRPFVVRGSQESQWPAHTNWKYDSYFLDKPSGRYEEGTKIQVIVETRHKEDRTASPLPSSTFTSFVESYNASTHYLVSPLPRFLRGDVQVPPPFQCEESSNLESTSLQQFMMWFSAGGTTSVLHTDSYENVNCLIRGGSKRLILIDPVRFANHIDLDRIVGMYSSVDVDDVDFIDFPGLHPDTGVELVTVTLHPGDCVYIPLYWFHQVRSYGSNIAVNFWFHNTRYLASDCTPIRDGPLTLANAIGLDDPLTGKSDNEEEGSRAETPDSQAAEVFRALVLHARSNITTFIHNDFLDLMEFFFRDVSHLLEKPDSGFFHWAAQFFNVFDVDSNHVLDQNDLSAMTQAKMTWLKKRLTRLIILLREARLSVAGLSNDEDAAKTAFLDFMKNKLAEE